MGTGQFLQNVLGRARRIHIQGKRDPDEVMSRLPACPGWGTEDAKTGSRSTHAAKERSGVPGLIAATDDRANFEIEFNLSRNFLDFLSRF
jgi:hypothetical protein